VCYDVGGFVRAFKQSTRKSVASCMWLSLGDSGQGVGCISSAKLMH
jgi:hypothetical protein